MKPAKSMGWKVVSYGSGALAALLTRKALVKIWSGVGDSPPPDDLSNRKVPWSQALTWAVASGVGMGVSRLVAMRAAATVWEAATHEPPPGEEST